MSFKIYMLLYLKSVVMQVVVNSEMHLGITAGKRNEYTKTKKRKRMYFE